MQPNGLPRLCRLHLKRDFEEIIRGGIKLQYNGVVLWARAGAREDSRPVRFAVVVSRKMGPAVVRNRAKRLLREAFRLNRKNILSGTDIIVSPRDGEKLSNVHAAQDALMTLCGRAALLGPSSENA
ncbi:MAG: ribonuclease P protein component [Candidatus Avelusimicrobium sp.]|uniref:ribonuclease P protein component n=1 Tax=Candidatus Avelusimicrobium sp. TaxID=3048833 RepID=UPI003EFEC48E